MNYVNERAEIMQIISTMTFNQLERAIELIHQLIIFGKPLDIMMSRGFNCN